MPLSSFTEKDKVHGANAILTEILKINISKMTADPPTMTRAQLDALEDLAAYQKIIFLIQIGDLTRAKILVQALDNTYYTEGEKAEIIAIIDTYNV